MEKQKLKSTQSKNKTKRENTLYMYMCNSDKRHNSTVCHALLVSLKLASGSSESEDSVPSWFNQTS